MSKPEDISQEAWEYALRWAWKGDLTTELVARAIMAATLAEREAIEAVIAERAAGEINMIAMAKSDDDAEGHLLHSLLLREQEEIADAIRKRGDVSIVHKFSDVEE